MHFLGGFQSFHFQGIFPFSLSLEVTKNTDNMQQTQKHAYHKLLAKNDANFNVYRSQVTFISIVLYAINIVSKAASQ